MSETDDAPEKRRAPFSLMWGMVGKPRATLTYLNAHGRGTWWLPALLAILLTISPVLAAAPATARRQREALPVVQEQVEVQGEEEMSAEEREEMDRAMSIVASRTPRNNRARFHNW